MTTFEFKIRFMIGTWNVRTLSEPSRLKQVQNEMLNYRLDILGLSEVRWPGTGEIYLQQGYHFIFSGNTAQRINGVGILLSAKAKRALLSYNAISDRIITVRLNSKFRKISLVQCYAPTELADDEEKDQFYSQLDSVIRSLPSGDIRLFIGDFNAKVGSNNNNLQLVMGSHGLGDARNDNGDRLVDFCARNRLYIGGTKFPHKSIHKYTWESPDGRTRNQIDHVLISKLFLGSLLDVKTRRGADIDSDHTLLVATLRLRPAAINRDQPKRAKLNLSRLHDPQTAQAFTSALSNKLQTNNSTSWNEVGKICLETATAVLGIEKRSLKSWMNNETLEEIKKRKRLRIALIRAKSAEARAVARADYRASASLVKSLVRRDKQLFFSKLAEQAETAANTGNLRAVYASIKQMCGNNIRPIAAIKDANGAKLDNPDHQLERWRQFFSDDASLAEERQSENLIPTIRRNPRRDIPTTLPTLEEVELALQTLKNGKAAGPDQIPAELLRFGSNAIARAITPIIREAWDANVFPTEWKKGVIVTIPKKGDLSECKNWRGITLLNAISKVMASLLLQRISPALDSILRKEQAGFRPGRSCADHINTLRIIIEQSAELNAHLYLLFVDFERAFDTVSRGAMWTALVNKGIPVKIVTLISELYRNAEISVRFNGRESAPFGISRGVKQGCILSPTLFLILLDSALDATNTQAPGGIRWNINEFLGDIDYADDICFFAHRFEDIEAKLKRLSENAAKVGLKINTRKTKLMRIGTSNVNPLSIHGHIIEDVDSFCYLGSKITKDGGSEEDICDRINKARSAFLTLNKVWRCNTLSQSTKVRIFNCSVMAVLLYGCTTWSLTQSTSRKLQVFINRCLRQILRIFWPNRISNEELLLRTNTIPVEIEIRRRKWTWLGHILRRPNNEIARTVLDWNPQGQRRRGRPRNTWIRCTKRELEATQVSWNQAKTLAKNRVRWRELVDALCSL